MYIASSVSADLVPVCDRCENGYFGETCQNSRGKHCATCEKENVRICLVNRLTGLLLALVNVVGLDKSVNICV